MEAYEIDISRSVPHHFPMEQFVKIFGNVARDKQTLEAAKDGIGIMIKCLDKAEERLDKIPRDKFNSAAKMLQENVHKKMINLVRDGTINEEYLEKMHRLRMTLPSDITQAFEDIVNAYYEKYKN
jgi:hypothetical protein